MSSLAVTILMPCLNEAETLATCIRKARAAIAEIGLEGEVLIADNGSRSTKARASFPSPLAATAQR